MQSSCCDKSCMEVVSLLSLEASRQMPHRGWCWAAGPNQGL